MTVRHGRSTANLTIGAALVAIAIMCISGGAASKQTSLTSIGVLLLLVGVFMVLRFFLGNNKAYVFIDFSKKGLPGAHLLGLELSVASQSMPPGSRLLPARLHRVSHAYAIINIAYPFQYSTISRLREGWPS